MFIVGSSKIFSQCPCESRPDTAVLKAAVTQLKKALTILFILLALIYHICEQLHTHTHCCSCTLSVNSSWGKTLPRGYAAPWRTARSPLGIERKRESGRGGKGYIDAAPACKLIAIVEFIGRQNMHTTTAAATLKKQKRHFVVFIVLVFLFLLVFCSISFFVVLIKFVFPLHIFGGFLFFFLVTFNRTD